MYLKKLICENAGPIKDITISFNFDNDKPVPCVVVGENGSGKSILLSYIADSFFEIAEYGYVNATKKASSGHEYFRVISNNQIRVGTSYCVSYIEYSDKENTFTYYCKSGKESGRDFISKHQLNKSFKWNEDGNDKRVIISEIRSKELFTENVICYFPPSRYEKPNWLGNNYYDVMFRGDDTYDGQLRNPIIVNDVTNELIQWLFDIITDSKLDVEYYVENMQLKSIDSNFNISDHVLMSVARQNVEKIMSTILGQSVRFRMGYRNTGRQRLSICGEDEKMIIPSLDALSTGQMALFLLFASIARYADNYDLNRTIKLDRIKGIVVIDEIDLHLHSKLQREVLPKLLRLFPGVQFIFSTHSPLVLMGLKEEYGDGIDIIEMPKGNYITAERFTEFEKAYAYYTETEKYRNEFQNAIDKKIDNGKALIITEGATDWRHIKAAFNHLSKDQQNEWLQKLEFELLEYDPENSESDNKLKIGMGAEELLSMVIGYSKIPQKKKMIFIADNDKQNIRNKLMEQNRNYKSWGNSVYSLTLPVPVFREDTPEICIEHLYHDTDIKRWVCEQSTKRRVFMGNEFDQDGFYLEGDAKYFCRDKNACGPGKIQIIDGSGNRKVIEPFGTDKNKNYALSKMEFAKKVLAQECPFNNIDFSGFIPLFKVLNEILKID